MGVDVWVEYNFNVENWNVFKLPPRSNFLKMCCHLRILATEWLHKVKAGDWTYVNPIGADGTGFPKGEEEPQNNKRWQRRTSTSETRSYAKKIED